MNDYFATVKVQHGLLKKAMEDVGIKSVGDLSDASGVDKAMIYNLLNFRLLPVDHSGRWNESALKICKALNQSPNDLFPERLQHIMGSNASSWYFSQREFLESMQNSLDPFEIVAREELSESLDEAMTKVTPKEKEIIMSNFFNMESLGQVARRIGVTCQAVSLAKQRALKKLRHPATIRKLEKHLK